MLNYLNKKLHSKCDWFSHSVNFYLGIRVVLKELQLQSGTKIKSKNIFYKRLRGLKLINCIDKLTK